jgi:hypothetical protein
LILKTSKTWGVVIGNTLPPPPLEWYTYQPMPFDRENMTMGMEKGITFGRRKRKMKELLKGPAKCQKGKINMKRVHEV